MVSLGWILVAFCAVIHAEEINPDIENLSFDTLSNDLSPSSEERADGHIQARIRSGEVVAKGTNLGGWLVNEKWMTSSSDVWANVPDQYSGGGEFVVMKYGNDQEKRREAFLKHHATFITEKDIEEIAKVGLNTVRVPVGYWITGEDPYDTSKKNEYQTYPQTTLPYLDLLIKDWAVKHNIAVLISLHSGKGSQNGQDHSAPSDPGKAYWSKFSENVENTIYVAKFLADRYKNEEAFLGIGLLNEPSADTSEQVLNQYYQDAYKAIRDTGNDCIISIMPLLSKQVPENLNGFMEAPTYTNVWVEWHPYFLWGYEKVGADELVQQSILTQFQEKIKKWNSRPNANKMFFGEWSLGNAGQYKNEQDDAYQKWAQAQITVMNQAKAGWTFWSWRLYNDEKTYNPWSFRSVLRNEKIKSILLK